MQVVFGKNSKESLGDRFTFLELDTFYQEGLVEPLTAYAVIGAEDINLEELSTLDNFTRIHNDMLKEYKKQNWAYCHQALEHLKGRWRKNLDSFYEIFEARIKDLENTNLSADWDGIVRK